MTPFKDDIKTQAHNIWVRVQKAGFWWIILFLLGIATGFQVAERISSARFDDAVKLGGTIHKTIVYDIKLRP